MQSKLMKTRFGLLYSLVAAMILLVGPSGSPAVAAGEGEAFIVLPGEAPRYGGERLCACAYAAITAAWFSMEYRW